MSLNPISKDLHSVARVGIILIYVKLIMYTHEAIYVRHISIGYIAKLFISYWDIPLLKQDYFI
jgi:hypothetical protein